MLCVQLKTLAISLCWLRVLEASNLHSVSKVTLRRLQPDIDYNPIIIVYYIYVDAMF